MECHLLKNRPRRENSDQSLKRTREQRRTTGTARTPPLSRNARVSIDTAVPRRIPRILPHEEHVDPSHGPLLKDGSGAIGAFRGPSYHPRHRRRRRREALVPRASLGDPTPTYRVQRQHLLRRATARMSSLPGTWAAAHGPGE